MNYFPIFTRLREKRVLVVGAGSVACRKITLLLKAQADITVVAPQGHQQVSDWHDMGRINWLKREFSRADIENVWLVIAATNNETINQQVCETATQHCVFTNVVDDRLRSEFITPAIVDRSPIQVAISSGGDAPVLARSIKIDLEKQLPEKLGVLAEQMGLWREQVSAAIPEKDRRAFWEQLLASTLPERLYQGKNVDSAFHALLNNSPQEGPQGSITIAHIYSSDPELLPLKTLTAMQHADTVFYSSGINDAVIEHIRRDADRIHIGRKPGQQSIDESQLEPTMLSLVQQGQRVMLLSHEDTSTIQQRIGQAGSALTASMVFIPGISTLGSSR